jgi:hypothetical protein
MSSIALAIFNPPDDEDVLVELEDGCEEVVLCDIDPDAELDSEEVVGDWTL